MKKVNILLTVFFAVVLVFGITLLLIPYFTEQEYQSDVLADNAEFVSEIQISGPPRSGADSAAVKNEAVKNEIDYAGLYAAMKTYNEGLFQNGQILTASDNGFDVAEYGITDGIIGYIHIPRLEVTMPLRVGSSRAVLDSGAGVLTGSSLPIGGANTNAVIAAHRGWNGTHRLRYIERLEAGDIIIIDTLFGRIEYRVTGSKIVQKGDTKDLYIVPGEDRITLYTCHPYSVNTQRYLVFAERKN